MRWLMITRKLDPTDDRAGFMMRWVETLAARIDHLDVICQETAHPALPPNVTAYSMGKESGVGRLGQALRFTQHLRKLVPQVDGVFCHMIPRYVLFAAPWAKLYHKPLLQWYTHRQISLELRIARRLSTHILTASPHSYPLPNNKITVMGHGIEIELFPDPAPGEDTPPALIMVGRLAHIKRQDWLLRAASRVMARGGAGPFRVLIVGGSVPNEPDYPAELTALAGRLDPSPDTTLTGPLPHDEAARVMHTCAVSLNLSPVGLFDKSALESMLAAKPTVVTNPDFLPLLGSAADLLYLPGTAGDDALADRLAHLLAMTPDERYQLGMQLRARTLEAHSLDGLMDRLVALMREATSHD